MLVFGVDVPLVEVVLTLTVIMLLLLIEAVVIIFLLIKQLNKTKETSKLVHSLSTTLLEIKKLEVERLGRAGKK